jgi:hypothetical protein
VGSHVFFQITNVIFILNLFCWQLGIIVTKNKRAEKLTELSGKI